jgi:hypothetical protein
VYGQRVIIGDYCCVVALPFVSFGTAVFTLLTYTGKLLFGHLTKLIKLKLNGICTRALNQTV